MFIVNVVFINPTWEMVVSNVINRPVDVATELNAIAKIYKYKRFHEGHHFILMAMEVHNTSQFDMDCFIRECVHLFHNRRLEGHSSLSFCIQFCKQCVNIALQHALIFAIERKITFMGVTYSKPSITIRSHDYHACDIKRLWVI
jgi:hypothetical protein